MFINNPLSNTHMLLGVFEWHFEWFMIGMTNWNQLNDKMDGMKYLT